MHDSERGRAHGTSPGTYSRFSYDAHARSCEPTEYLKQVMRTVGGQPLDDTQIAMIHAAVRRGLALTQDSVLLDLCCGNGALSSELFPDCAAYTGVDLSEYLISVARERFARGPDFTFVQAPALEFLQQCPDPERYSHALCYAGIQYFSDPEAEALLRLIHTRFHRIERVFIGNQPDRNRSEAFFRMRSPSEAELDDHGTALGRLRSSAAFCEIARSSGWHPAISTMPPAFVGAAYRYDTVLTR